MTLSWDWETRSPVNLPTHGPYVYAMHPDTDALLASYKLKWNDEAKHPPEIQAWVSAGGALNKLMRWKRGEPCPAHVRAYIEAGGQVSAHNAAFERLIWWHVMVPKHKWPKPRMEQFRCTAVTAAAMSLPRSLERLGDALDLSIKKDKRGSDLMKIHSIPIGFDETGKAIWHPKADDPESLELYHQYCDSDVLSEEEADSRLIPLSDDEMKIYWLNETINDRGLRIDTVSATAALRLIDEAKRLINEELTTVTDKAATAVTQAAKLKNWAEAQGVFMPSMDKDDVNDFLHDCDDLPDRVRRALELRQEGAKPSVDKIAAMMKRVDSDGRARGVYLHNGAGQTGRFSSRGVQAHNMPKYRKIFEDAKISQSELFDTIRSGDPNMLTFMYGADLGRPLHLLSDAVRGFIWAAPGHDFVCADYSSIEGRLAAWFAGEEWLLEAFRSLDRGEGFGIYELAAAGIYNIPVETVDKKKRASGKVATLALGYQGGAGALAKMARQNGIKLPTVFDALWESVSPERRTAAEKRFEERLEKHDALAMSLGKQGWIAAELIKVGWRAKHPKIVELWGKLEDAAIDAVNNPGSVVNVVGAKYTVAHGFLWCRLPSGRCLAYGSPKMGEVEAPWADKTVEPAKREKKLSLTVRGVDAVSEKWIRFPTYGGSLANNLIQGSARDILTHGMFSSEKAGYPVVLHTHDEMAAEVPHGFGSVEEYQNILSVMPDWAKTLPMTASGWRGKRYRKD